MKALVFGVLLSMSAHGAAFAWGDAGHEAVAIIAEKLLSPSASAKVNSLVADGGEESLAKAALWADKVKHRPEGTGTDKWHYVDIPVTASSYDAWRDCRPDEKPDNCIVAQLPLWISRLKGGSTADQAVALKWVAHLVGDIHQPLHAAEAIYQGQPDAGGNKEKVQFFGKATSLHTLWDSDLIARQFAGKSSQGIADALEPIARNVSTAAVSGSLIRDWAMESHALAKRVAYGQLPRAEPYVLGPQYAAAASPVIEQQLARAGARLAAILNAAFK